MQKASEIDISAGLGVAVREFPLATGFADYMLYVDRGAAGVIETKPDGHALTGVEIQLAIQKTYGARAVRRFVFGDGNSGDVRQEPAGGRLCFSQSNLLRGAASVTPGHSRQWDCL